MRILGIDYGLKRVGLALADNSLAQPFEVIDNDSRLVEKVAKICQTNQIEKIIIGLPEGKVAKRVRKFAQELTRVANFPVVFQDETLTSQEAIAKMIQAGKGRDTRKKIQDAIAAAIILQSYLNSHV